MTPPSADFGSTGIVDMGGMRYKLVPYEDGGPGATQRMRSQRSQLQEYAAEELKDVKEFKYEPLPPSRKRIRLLKLRSGTTSGREIFCELVDADYDDDFHIPELVTEAKREAEGSPAKPKPSMQPGTNTIQGVVKPKHDECELCRDPKNHKGTRNEAEDQKARKEAEAERAERGKRLENETGIKYEALSWSWGTAEPKYAIQIHRDGHMYKKKVSENLALALKYLRLPNRERILWVDAICINQESDNEKNHQVQMMSHIYTRASEVAIWLGEDTDDSVAAIKFIKDEIMRFSDFDKICNDKQYADKWRSLMMLMQREWFSRRWVIQEIALASKAKIYCGPDSIPWREFAVAVELFVEVESATHRLSEIMKQDERFRHVPGWFEHISELGASLLVQATGKVFRAPRMPLREMPNPNEKSEGEQPNKTSPVAASMNNGNTGGKKEDQGRPTTIDPLDRRSLLSLEYLVTTMYIFGASQPRDAIYALLAIARDAAPFAKSTTKEGDASMLTASVMENFLEEKPFTVDYSRSYSDVCRDFVEFSIRRKSQLDDVQALDILCRPWALESAKARSTPEKRDDKGPVIKRTRVLLPPGGGGPRDVRQVGVQVYPVKNKDQVQWRWKYVFPTAPKGKDDWRKDKTLSKYWKHDDRTLEKYWTDVEEADSIEDNGRPNGAPRWKKHPSGWKDVLWYFPLKQEAGSTTESSESRNDAVDVAIPSWVTLASKAPFSLYYQPGVHVLKTGRANADPLVGQPQDGHRNYSAAQTNPVDLNELKFRKRQRCGHYSLYVRGFELGEVEEVLDASQGGNIPKSWLEMAGWTDYSKDPPDHFWRTIVADRGKDNRNPPYYYATACKESVLKGGVASGRVNTADLINNERNSIVAEFCRRVQAVVWGRRLFKTKNGTLGLASNVEKGDYICILYGCTVPVIMAKNSPSETEDPVKIRKREEFDDAVEALRSCMQELERKLQRKARYRERMAACPNYSDKIKEWKDEARRKEVERYGNQNGLGARRTKVQRRESTHSEDGRASQSDRQSTDRLSPLDGSSETPAHDSRRHSGAAGEGSNAQGDKSGGDVDTPRDGPAATAPSTQAKLGVIERIATSLTKPSRGKKKKKGGKAKASLDDSAGSPLGKSTTWSGNEQTEAVPQEEATTTSSTPKCKDIDAGRDDCESASNRLPDHGHATSKRDRPSRHRHTERESPRYTEKTLPQEGVFYTFKGETYIHGMMDGEALREKFWHGKPDILFEIR